METIQSSDGTRIAYARSGKGPPLVLVHGTSGSHKRWAPVLPLLEAKFTVCAVERRGRGESGDAPGYALQREFEDVAAVLDAMPEPAHLLGHSFGAICSLEAARISRNLRNLVLYEPPMPSAGHPVFPPGTIERLQAMLDAGDPEGVLTVFFREVNGMPLQEFEKFRGSPIWQARLAAAHTLPREIRAVQAYRFDATRFREMAAPTLLLLGGNSPAYFGAAIEMVANALPDCRTRILPGQQHIAMDMAPALFADEVLTFLASAA